MLNYLFLQVGLAFLAFGFMVVGVNFLDSRNRDLVFAAVMFVLAIVTAICYFLDIFIWHNYEWSLPWMKAICFIFAFFVFAPMFIFWNFHDVHGIYTLIVLLVFMLIAHDIVYTGEKTTKYDMQVVEQEAKVEITQYELISASSDSTIEGSIQGSIEGSSFGMIVYSGTVSGNVDGSIQQTDVYKFFYVANSTTGEIRSMTLEAKNTAIFYTKEGEKPYLVKKVTTPYSLDYNVDPPKECDFGTSIVAYELHIPEGSISGSFDLNPSK